jgi:SAM-dependent methyltransferase
MPHDDDPSGAFKAFEAGTWAGRAATYDLVTGAVTAQVAGPLLDAAQVGRGTRVLDVGCGPGTVAAAAAARGARPDGVDLAPAMVALARSRHPGIPFQVGDAEALPSRDGAYGAVVAGFLVNHVPSPERALAECARVLAPGGRLALALWAPADDNPLLGELSAAVAESGVDVREGLPPGPDPYRLAGEAPMRRALEAAGLSGVRQGTLRLVHRASGAQALWEGLMGGSARISTVIARRPEAERAAIRAAFDARVARWAGPEGLAVPATVVLASARR